jgi:murein DD-endopeptidase MepM/ murein hydrolase activator NlpD
VSAGRIAGTPGAAAPDAAQGTPALDKAQVAKLAAEFESLLLSNIFKDMRSAGRWSDEDSSDMLGASAFNQTFDTELARTLSQSGGFGLSGFLQKALERYAPDAAASVPAPTALTPPIAAVAVTPAAVSVPAALAAPAILERAAAADTSGSANLPGIEDLRRPAATLTSAFGWRKDPLTGVAKFHKGVDLKAAEGDPVGATGAGKVVFSGPNGSYGNSVVIEHANGVSTRYAHLSAPLVHVGDEVSEGQAIGLAGHTGRATGPHVHYEVLAQGRAVDPLR